MKSEVAATRDLRVVPFEEKLGDLCGGNLADDWYLRAVSVLRGGDGGEHGVLLYKLARDSARRCDELIALDVGTARGFSALVMAKAVGDSKVAGTVYTVDTVSHRQARSWHGTKHREDDPLAGLRLSREEIWNRWFEQETGDVVAIGDRSTNVLMEWQQGPIDIAFLDGSHEFEDVTQELVLLDDLMSHAGIVVLDDYHVGEIVGRVRSRLLNGVAWWVGRVLGRFLSPVRRISARPGESTEYRLVKQRFVGVRRAVDEFVGSRRNRWSMEIVRMPTRGPYQGPDYSLVVLSRRGDIGT